ncbi:MAG: hypothetical protein HQK59_15790 [Deltaproteobacteria bacterium]|nr:hypothetical protein [Deltaproteobacteria bacterium]
MSPSLSKLSSIYRRIISRLTPGPGRRDINKQLLSILILLFCFGALIVYRHSFPKHGQARSEHIYTKVLQASVVQASYRPSIEIQKVGCVPIPIIRPAPEISKDAGNPSAEDESVNQASLDPSDRVGVETDLRKTLQAGGNDQVDLEAESAVSAIPESEMLTTGDIEQYTAPFTPAPLPKKSRKPRRRAMKERGCLTIEELRCRNLQGDIVYSADGAGCIRDWSLMTSPAGKDLPGKG